MLNPNSRSLYTSALTPPPGMLFGEAIATTFSMDPALLLEAPLYLALMARGNKSEPDPLSILEAIRRYAKSITVYVQKGRIQVPQDDEPTPLFGLLEDMIVQVKAPNGGLFHPKVWVIRFVSREASDSKSDSILRLVVLTRNMTTDQSWDLSLQLEGVIKEKGRKAKVNKPLEHFLKTLPQFAVGNVEHGRLEQAIRFSEDIRRVQWELPDSFDELAFYLPGSKEFAWEPPLANRMAVISPFCSDKALQKLVKKAKSTDAEINSSTGPSTDSSAKTLLSKADALISRPESMAAIKPETLNCFDRCLQLDEAAETEDGEEDDPLERPLSTGLHAKVYLFETRYYSDYTHIVMGSANATNAALLASKNVEILVELIGKKNRVGGIDELLGEDSLGEYLILFDSPKEANIDLERQAAEKHIEKARLQLAQAELSLICQRSSKENLSKENLWSLILAGAIPPLEGIVSAVAWPITLKYGFNVKVMGENSSRIVLGEFSASSITSLIAFELKTEHPDVSARFVLNLPIDEIPEERNSAILQTVIRNQDGFIRYLLLLLSDDTLDNSFTSANGSGFAKWLSYLAKGEKAPLLEELTRAYSRYPDRLHEISEIVSMLSSQDRENSVIPESFLKLWSVFESALEGRNVR